MDNIYINIGSTKSCLFVKVSLLLLKQLNRNPFLFYAVEEAQECAKNGYYASGIIVFAQLLNLLNETTPQDRHMVAHEILISRPTKVMYDEIKSKFEAAAAKRNKLDLLNSRDPKQYEQKLRKSWDEFLLKVNGVG